MLSDHLPLRPTRVFEIEPVELCPGVCPSVQARFITKNQNLAESQALGLASNSRNQLRSWQAKASYFYNQTIGVTAGYFCVFRAKSATHSDLIAAIPI